MCHFEGEQGKERELEKERETERTKTPSQSLPMEKILSLQS